MTEKKKFVKTNSLKTIKVIALITKLLKNHVYEMTTLEINRGSKENFEKIIKPKRLILVMFTEFWL